MTQRFMVAIIAIALASPASAAEFMCPPDPATRTDVDGNLVVPEGETCTPGSFVRIKGNVRVGPGAVFKVKDAEIQGNVKADRALRVHLKCTSVLGNVLAKDGRGASAETDLVVAGSKVFGNLQAEGLRGVRLRASTSDMCLAGVQQMSTVLGGVQVFHTTGVPEDFSHNLVCGARICGDLQVFGSGSSAPVNVGWQKAQGGLCSNRIPLKVDGKIQVMDNARQELVSIGDAEISDDLQCDMSAIDRGGNTIGGEDKCP